MLSASHTGLLLTSIALGAVAQLLFKSGVDGALPADGILSIIHLVVRARVIGGIACYAASLMLWLLAIRHIPISIAYPSVSLGYVAVFFGGRYVLGEQLHARGILGLAIIVLGVIVLSTSQQATGSG